ncbi:MAG: J domain-containing protein [Magnetospiraceae bacterium]
MTEYVWYCLDHIRAVNRAWNYYEGLSEDEVEADLRLDTTWRRPSWKFGTTRMEARAREQFYEDPLRAFDGQHEDKRHQRYEAETREPPEQARALKTLGLSPPTTLEAVKARYKELVKCHHPDANQGSKESEEKFKEISDAYRILRDWFTTKTANA